MPDSSELIALYDDYVGTDGKSHQSRKPTTEFTWLITVKGGKVYAVKFDKNFVKKHLYTSSKKTDKVSAKAQELYVAAGSPKDKSAKDFEAEAQRLVDEAKFTKQLGHRSEDEQSVCASCGHPKKKHFNAKGTVQLACKELKGTAPCGCTNWVPKYQGERVKANKPTGNPLEGAPTSTNTIIWMNKIDRASFEKVVSDAIIAKEVALGTTAWGSKGEHIKWDFGSGAKGCVLTIEAGKPPSDWKQLQGVEVVINQKSISDPARPIYEVCHMEGKNAF